VDTAVAHLVGGLVCCDLDSVERGALLALGRGATRAGAVVLV
jgi:hypothetical protein